MTLTSVSLTNRSKITNGSRLHKKGDADGRSREARRFRDLLHGFCRDLDREPREADRALARQAAALTLEAEALQAKIASGADVDADALVRTSNALTRCVLALKRRTKPATAPAGPSLADFLAARYGASDPGEAEGGHLDGEDAAEATA
jgi:hypothetical protein